MHLSAKADYALRAAVQLATSADGPVSSRLIARTQGIPAKYLESILAELRHAGLVTSRLGGRGGYALSRPAGDISVADLLGGIESGVERGCSHAPLPVWTALQSAQRHLLEGVSLADLATGTVPPHLAALTHDVS